MGSALRQGKKIWWAIGCVVFVGILLFGLCCPLPPPSFKAVKAPRGGHPIGRHVAVVYSKHYQINLGGLERVHSYDIRKYAKIYLKLNTDGYLRPEDVFVPEEVTVEQLLRVHDPKYLQRLKDPAWLATYLEAPIIAWGPAAVMDFAILHAFRYATGGTILASRLALKHGIAINLGGGYHHAKPYAGGGFCIYADMPIAVRTLQAEGLIRRALIVDLDAHQGNGTDVCFAGDPDVFTFDMHEKDIYPRDKEKSSLDIPLPAGTNDDSYLRLLRENLPAVMDRAKPDIIFLQAGCDPLKGDPLAHLVLTEAGIVARDATVIDACVARDIPVVMVLGGGYSPQAWTVHYASIRRTIEKYGLPSGRRYPTRSPSVKEKLYTK